MSLKRVIEKALTGLTRFPLRHPCRNVTGKHQPPVIFTTKKEARHVRAKDRMIVRQSNKPRLGIPLDKRLTPPKSDHLCTMPFRSRHQRDIIAPQLRRSVKCRSPECHCFRQSHFRPPREVTDMTGDPAQARCSFLPRGNRFSRHAQLRVETLWE